jgi:nicotinamidase-related amidase
MVRRILQSWRIQHYHSRYTGSQNSAIRFAKIAMEKQRTSITIQDCIGYNSLCSHSKVAKSPFSIRSDKNKSSLRLFFRTCGSSHKKHQEHPFYREPFTTEQETKKTMTMMEQQQQQQQQSPPSSVSPTPSPPPCVEKEALVQQQAKDTTTSSTASRTSQQQQQQQRQPYEELKWTEGPLYCADPSNTTAAAASLVLRDEPPLTTTTTTTAASAVTTTTAANTTASTTTTPTPPQPPPPQARVRLPLHGETTALLIVDVQPEYWSHCPSVQQDFGHFPTCLARTLETCRSRHAKIIWVRADYRHSHSPWLVQFERLRGQLPGYMVEVPCDIPSPPHGGGGSISADSSVATTTTTTTTTTMSGWEDFATPRGGEVVIPKTSWSSTSDTALKQVLRANGIDTVLVCGLITSVCVQHSAFGVFEAGYRTLLVTDACADRGRARHEAALALYGGYMYELVTSIDLQNVDTGLLPAKPVWLTLDSIRPLSFIHSSNNKSNNISNKSSGGGGGGGSISSGGTSSSSSSSKSSTSSGIVSPLGSFGDLQNALFLVDNKNSPTKIGSSNNSNDGNDDTTGSTAASSSQATTTSSSSVSSSVVVQCL